MIGWAERLGAELGRLERGIVDRGETRRIGRSFTKPRARILLSAHRGGKAGAAAKRRAIAFRRAWALDEA